MKLAVYLPALNESATIAAMLDAIPAHIPGITSLTKIVVDDGSTDGTGDIARCHGAEVVRHQRNLGTGRAFMSGVQSSIASGADIIVSIDADGQFAATSIPELIAPILRHAADVVLCTRFGPNSQLSGSMAGLGRLTLIGRPAGGVRLLSSRQNHAE